MGCVGGGASETLFVTLFKVPNLTPPHAWAILMKLRKKSILARILGARPHRPRFCYSVESGGGGTETFVPPPACLLEKS